MNSAPVLVEGSHPIEWCSSVSQLLDSQSRGRMSWCSDMKVFELPIASAHNTWPSSLSPQRRVTLFGCPLCTVIRLKAVLAWCHCLADAVPRRDSLESRMVALMSHLLLVVSTEQLVACSHISFPDSTHLQSRRFNSPLIALLLLCIVSWVSHRSSSF
jgi:hypothetical protein